MEYYVASPWLVFTPKWQQNLNYALQLTVVVSLVQNMANGEEKTTHIIDAKNSYT